MQTPPGPENQFHRAHVQLLVTSYQHWIGASLVDSSLSADEQAKALFDAPLAIVSHDKAEDPIFNYGNRMAMELFELEWPDFVQLPSRMSAEPLNRAERQRMLSDVTKQGYIDDYSGVRISATGRRFWIPKATVWNLIQPDGAPAGQAACFSEWKFLEK